jgi:DNA-binding MarR family transcriptional regulator
MPDPSETAEGREDSPEAVGRVYFELFNEVGIIAQLSRALFEGAQTDGLTVPHFSVLNHLARLGDGRTPLELSRAFQTPKASMTNTLAGLEARGLVETRPNPGDGRGKLVFLTEAGRARREAAIASAGPRIVSIVAEHDVGTARALVPLLAELRAVLDRNRR